MKKILIVTGIVFAVIVALIIFGIRSIFMTKSDVTDVIPTPSVVLPTVPDSVKVELYSKDNNKSVGLNISGIPSGVESVEYELIYQTSSGLSRGVNGKRKIEDLPIKDITLGSCSTGGKCTYDEGVKSIDLVLKFNTADGASIFRKTFPLN